MKMLTGKHAIGAAALMAAMAATSARSAEPAPAPAAGAQPVVVRAVARFDFDRTTIDEKDRARILADVGKMKDVTWQTVTATGHTDSVGPTRYNAQLSEKRAEAVKTYLVGKGLQPDMIEAVGKASESPIADNGSPEGRARNRRTEVEFRGVRSTPQ